MVGEGIFPVGMSAKKQWRIEGTIFVPKNAPLTEGGKKLPIFGTKLVAKKAAIQFGIRKG
jgi:hypothetical protein